MLFLHVARIALEKQPKVLVLENVPGLVTLQQGKTLLLILRAISRAGYSIAYKIIEARPLVPQYRRRIYIIGVRNDLISSTSRDSSSDSSPFLPKDSSSSLFSFPTVPNLSRTVRWILDPSSAVKPRHDVFGDKLNRLFLALEYASKVNWKLAGLDRPAGTLVTSYRRGYLSQFVSVEEATAWEKEKEVLMEKYRKTGTFDHSSLPTNPIKRGKLPPPGKFRFYTEKECARIMGFPRDFYLPIDAGEAVAAESYGMLGNAVSPPIVAAITGMALEFVNKLEKPESCEASGDKYKIGTSSIRRAIALALLSATPDEEAFLVSQK